jgi:hypothetical protein
MSDIEIAYDINLVKKLENLEFMLWIEEEIQIQRDRREINDIYKEFLRGNKIGV